MIPNNSIFKINYYWTHIDKYPSFYSKNKNETKQWLWFIRYKPHTFSFFTWLARHHYFIGLFSLHFHFSLFTFFNFSLPLPNTREAITTITTLYFLSSTVTTQCRMSSSFVLFATLSPPSFSSHQDLPPPFNRSSNHHHFSCSFNIFPVRSRPRSTSFWKTTILVHVLFKIHRGKSRPEPHWLRPPCRGKSM
jgi:hypothetical protein